MRLERMALRGFGPFREDLVLDFRGIEGQIVAVAGPNGAGKSTLLELFPAGLYREGPTRGSLAGLATARDAYLELAVVNGKAWTIRQTVDAVSGQGEALVLDAAGAVVDELKGAKVRAFDKWARKNLPPPEVLYASIFAPQGSGGFLELSAGERKAVLLRVLGVEYLEGLAEAARKRLADAKARLQTAVARLEDERSRSVDIDEAQKALVAAQAAVTESGGQLDQARRALADGLACVQKAHEEHAAFEQARNARAGLVRAAVEAESRVQELRRRGEENDAVLGLRDAIEAATARLAELDREAERLRAEMTSLEHEERDARRDAAEQRRRADEAQSRRTAAERRAADRRAELEQRIQAARARIADAEKRIEAGEALLRRATEVRAAADRIRAIDLRLAAIQADRGRLEAEARGYDETVASHRKMARTALERAGAAGRRAESAQKRLVDRAKVRTAEEAIPKLRAAVEAATAEAERAIAEMERLARLQLESGAQRIRALRGVLVEIREGRASNPARTAAKGIERDDRAAAEAEAAPGDERAARTEAQRARKAAEAAAAELAAAERLVALVPAMVAAEEEFARAAEDAQQAQAEHWAAQDAEQQSMRLAQCARDGIDALDAEAEGLHAERTKLLPRANEEKLIATAEGLLPVRRTQRKEALEEATHLAAELEAVPPDGGDEARDATAQAAQAMKAAEEAQSRVTCLHVEIQTKAATLRERLRERESLEAVAREADALARAEALAEELARQFDAAERAQHEAHVTLEATPEPSPPLPVPDIAELDAAERAAVQRASAAHADLAVKQAQFEQAQATARRRRVLEEERRRVEEEVADWAALAEDLGRDGLQALLIDAAGPELTELVNDLLRACMGPRWTVTMEATRTSADGKRQIEGYEVRVIDTLRGREGAAETLSGGERVLVGEAISLALSMLACRRAGLQGPTLVRDESGAALDPENARAYVAMLRRAADIVGASKVLFVSHNPEVQSLADARIAVQDGRVLIEA